jgi:adenylyltransferase/sulfurtransferase
MADRYSRQILFEHVGLVGQGKLAEGRVLLVGCGALGSVLADTLVRAGVGQRQAGGWLRICDRDYIERENLQRQVLFDEDDIAADLPKAEAAARKLRRINSEVAVEPFVVDVVAENVQSLAEGATILLDGTDNFETRYLVNDLAVQTRRPWVYGAVIGATGLCMTVIPHDTPCLRCVFEEAPPPEMNPTCDTAGVLAAAVNVVAAFQAVEAMKLLMGSLDQITRSLLSLDVWSGRVTSLKVQSAYEQGQCPCCKRSEFEYLAGKRGSGAVALCGRDAVQIHPRRAGTLDLSALARKLEPIAPESVRVNPYMLRAMLESYELTLFPDGRAIIKGTDQPDVARSLYAKYVGS